MKVALSSIIKGIEQGQFDPGLERFSDAIYRRRLMLREEKQRATRQQLTPGVKVKFGNTAKPQYLQGATGVFVGYKNSRAMVQMDAGQYLGKFAKWTANPVIHSPISLLEIINSEENKLKSLGQEISEVLNDV